MNRTRRPEQSNAVKEKTAAAKWKWECRSGSTEGALHRCTYVPCGGTESRFKSAEAKRLRGLAFGCWKRSKDTAPGCVSGK